MVRILGDRVAPISEELSLGTIHTVLAPRPLVIVVDEENSHTSCAAMETRC
jgi:hypothetical protein